MNKFRDWELFETLPEGWKIDKTAGSPLTGFDFCNNGKSMLHPDHKRALVRHTPCDGNKDEFKPAPFVHSEKCTKKQAVYDDDYQYPARTVNELARQKFKQQILRDILVDLMICEIEGWCKSEYISEIRSLVNNIAKTKCITINNSNQLSMILEPQQ